MITIPTTINGQDARIHHNGDWSGDAIMTWIDETGQRQEARVPCGLLVATAQRMLEESYETALDGGTHSVLRLRPHR